MPRRGATRSAPAPKGADDDVAATTITDATAAAEEGEVTTPTMTRTATTYRAGDKGLWDDGELIRLWNEQLAAQRLDATDARDTHDLSAHDAAASDDDEDIDSSEGDGSSDDDDARGGGDGRSDGDAAANATASLPHAVVRRDRRLRHHSSSDGLDDDDDASASAREHDRATRHTLYSRLQLQQHQHYDASNGKSSSSSSNNNDKNSTVPSDTLAQLTHTLPHDVRALAQSFYAAGYAAGHYVGQRDAAKRRRTA